MNMTDSDFGNDLEVWFVFDGRRVHDFGPRIVEDTELSAIKLFCINNKTQSTLRSACNKHSNVDRNATCHILWPFLYCLQSFYLHISLFGYCLF